MSEERKRILSMVAEGKISIEEAEKLLEAIGSGAEAGGVKTEIHKKAVPKFMYVKVNSVQNDTVDVKVPLSLLRAGLKLTSLIPPIAMAKINDSMKDKGIAFDLANIKQEDIEELIISLGEMEVNVDSKNGDKVKVYCA